jgi:HNH endonuclease
VIRKTINPHLAHEMSDVDYLAHYLSRCKPNPKGCLEYQGGRNEKGYSQVSVRNKRWALTRFVYTVTYGEIPAGHMVCHRCDNPPCINPAHLYTGTMAENARDSVEKVRHFHASQTHCKHGHEFTPENTYLAKVPNRPDLIRRHCKECQRMAQRKRWYTNRDQMIAHQKRYREKKRLLQQVSEREAT